LRKADKKVILVVNKVDNDKVGEGVLDFYQMGLDKPYPVSALHNLGTGELMDEVVKEFPDSAGDDGKRAPIKIALVGRPNVGKSSFVNCLLNEERVIVDEVPGTTRDSVDTYFRGGDTEFILIDTAGLRHKRKVKEAVDIYSSMRSKDAIRKSDVCLVLIDGYDGLVSDDLKILEFVMKEGKFCILCVNKWDLIKGVLQKKYEDRIYERAAFLRKYPVVFTSVKNKYNVTGTLERVKQIIASVGVKIPTPELNKLLVSLKVRGPFSPKSNRLRIQYGTQIRSNPPTFLIFVNDPKFVSEVHVNYIENNIRDNFGFFGMPVRFEFRGAKGG